LEPRLFNLDAQLIHDAIFLMVSMLVMFTFLSYFLFNPVRNFLKKRQDKIKSDLAAAQKDKEDASVMKAEYDAKLKDVNREAEVILSDARQKALKNEAKIIEDAKAESGRILNRASAEIELEKRKAADDMKRQMVEIASLMAERAVRQAVDVKLEDTLVEETLKEIGDDTWQN
jgi:F-type H+-transporting ATPase subunit b